MGPVFYHSFYMWLLWLLYADILTSENISGCELQPCRNNGPLCDSLRGSKDHECECPRPYEGHNCAEEYVPARFGNKDLDSHAVFYLDDDPRDTLVVSMFLRTRRLGGLLLILANSTSQYLRLWVEEGRVKVQVNNHETLFSQKAVNDGHFHLLTLTVRGITSTLFQSSQVMDSVSVKPVHAHSGDLVFIGGLPDQMSSAEFGGFFQGCLQDLRINNKKLQFYPLDTSVKSYRLEKLVNVERGCSSDDNCAVSPCLNGGVCHSTWDDFTCTCPPNTTGRRCDKVKWCDLNPCPNGTICELRLEGFECLSNVTLHDKSSILHYQSNGKISHSLADVLLSFCSGQPTATLLFAQRGSAHLAVFLRDSRLVMELKTGHGNGTVVLTVQNERAVSDGVWHTAKISMESKSSRWIMDVDGDQRERSISGGNLDFLKEEGTDIFLGGKNRESEGKFSGCLGSVEIGGLLLPFLQDKELNLPRPQKEQFVKVNSDDVQRPCSLCQLRPCHNNGSCVTVPKGFKCECRPGYRGELCDEEVDTCVNNNCSRGSTCLRGFETYTCLCPRNITGQYCEDKVPELPWYIEMDPLPQLPVAKCEGARWEYNCYHGGTCSESNNTCHCLPGFTGHWCETDVDECVSEPCMNGGVCVNHVNSFQCVCDLNHSGVHCQVDVSDFYVYLFLGVWQSLFQAASYLLIRLDDEPEIDWVFHIND